MADIQSLAVDVHRLAAPGMTPKDLIAAVRKQNPDVSKKEVIRAAFYAVIAHADDGDGDKTARIHAMAITERGTDDEEEDRKKSKKDRKKNKD